MGIGKSLMTLALILATNHHPCGPPPLGREIAEGVFDVPAPSERQTRSLPTQLRLSNATLLVCPAILVDEWADELETHISEGLLSVCRLEGGKKLPKLEDLMSYDVSYTCSL